MGRIDKTKKILRSTKADQWKQLEDGSISSVSGNDYAFQVEGRAHPYAGVRGTWFDADNLAGDDARLAFVQGSPFLPVFFSRNSKPRRVVVDFSITISAWYSYRSDNSGDNKSDATGYLAGTETAADYRTLTGFENAFVRTHSSTPIIGLFDGDLVVGASSLAIAGEVFELITLDVIYIFFSNHFQKSDGVSIVGESETLVDPTSPAVLPYSHQAHPGRFCDPDGGVIGTG